MHHYFTKPSAIEDKTVTITGKDVNHIKNVLRIRPGEEISVSVEDSSSEYRCIVRELCDDKVICDLAFVKEEGNELPADIILLQGLPKSDKMELIIQKAVELGASKIVPVAMKRSVLKLEPSKAPSKIARWQAISEAAAKQSKRSVIPEVTMPMSVKEALAAVKDCDHKLLPYELSDDTSTHNIFDDAVRDLKEKENAGNRGSIAIFIGPEGGFDVSEVDEAAESGFKAVTLGKRILRTETAGMTVLSYLMIALEL